MGRQEIKNRQRTRRHQLRKIILGSVQLAGVLGVALVAPNVLATMKKLELIPSPRQVIYFSHATALAFIGAASRFR